MNTGESRSATSRGRRRLLVLTSTYPRWMEDPEPSFVHTLARELVSKGMEVVVVGPHAHGAAVREDMDGVRVVRFRYAPSAMQQLVNDGGIVTNLKARPWTRLLVLPFLLGLVFAAWRELRRFKPDVVHAHWIIPQGAAAATLSLIGALSPPIVVTSHGADLFTLRGRLASAIKRLTLRRAARVTVVSQAMVAPAIASGALRETVTVEPMGIDTTRIFFPDDRVERSRKELLFVGRIVEKKGLPILLDAMRILLDADPDAQLTIVGFGPEEATCRAKAASLGLEKNVHFVGAAAQARLPDFYRRARVLVAPFVESANGDQEGLGLVVVEALACGCPVVLSDLPATREIPHSAVDVTRVIPGDATELAGVLIRTLATAYVAPTLDISRFSSSTRADAYLALFESIS